VVRLDATRYRHAGSHQPLFMPPPLHIVGYAIVSADGMIADSSGRIPPALIHEADQQYFFQGMDAADVLVHGRNSYEDRPRASDRKRIIVTRQISAVTPDAENPNTVLWNPTGAAIERACETLGVTGGVVAAVGGSEVYGLFLPRYDIFHLSKAARAQMAGGRPVFPGIPPATPEDLLQRHGLRPSPPSDLDTDAGVSVTVWAR
jgi:dihydrofolate reductase